MCAKRTTKIGNRNVKRLKQYFNYATEISTELVRKMKIDGTIAYFVVTTDCLTGRHIRIFEFNGIKKAYENYMVACGLNHDFTI